MFNKNFFKFLFWFIVILFISVFIILVSSYLDDGVGINNTLQEAGAK